MPDSLRTRRAPFEAIKAFRRRIDAGDPPLGPAVTLTDPRITDALGVSESAGSDRRVELDTGALTRSHVLLACARAVRLRASGFHLD